MSTERTTATDGETKALGEDLKVQLVDLVEGLVLEEEAKQDTAFVNLLARIQELVDRKRAMEGTKTDTRDLIGELLFSRLRQAMRQFLKTKDAREEIRAAEWSIGCLFSIAMLTELANAFDQVLIRQGMGRDFSFAGRTDFISLEEVLQMLAAGKHGGCLSLEKADNRLDIYLSSGFMAFLDPHHMIRRVMPSADLMRHREIPEGAVALAETERTQHGTPVFLTLAKQGHFRKEELRDAMRSFGKEVLFDFMRAQEPYAFFYRRLDKLPDFVVEHNLRLSVTSSLLEGSKLLDDWRQLLKVFPDPTHAIVPQADMFARVANVTLAPIELKLLTQLTGEVSPKGLVHLLGVPLYDVYQLLVRLAREGILEPPGGAGVLNDIAGSVHESLLMAFAALDANEDDESDEVGDVDMGDEDNLDLSVLDDVFGKPLDARKGDRSPKDSGALMQKELLEMLRRNRKLNDQK